MSRRWCNLLRSPDLFKPTLRIWCDDTVNLDNANYADCFRVAQCIHRVQSGKLLEVSATKPFCELFVQDEGGNGPDIDPGTERLCLVDDFLIDVPFPFRHLRVTNLRTGQEWRAVADGRESVSRVAASDQLIAFWTSGSRTCYIFDFTGMRRAKLQLPPSLNKIATCRGRIVVCGGTLNGCIELYVWESDSNKGRTIRLEQSMFGSDHLKYVSSYISTRRVAARLKLVSSEIEFW